MNLRKALFAGSLLANAALVAVLLLRPAPLSSGLPADTPAANRRAAAPNPVTRDAATIQAALASGDRPALLAAGVSEEVARNLTLGRAFDKFQARARALRPAAQNGGRYWRRDPGFNPETVPKEQRAEINKAQREFSDAVRDAVGEDLDSLFSGREPRYAFLPAAKREQLRRIEQDYADMEQQVYTDQDGIQLPADREKIRLLRLEKDRDITAALTPAEREQYELRNSPTAMAVRIRYGDAVQNEEDYRKIYALQKAFDDQYPNPNLTGGAPLSPEAQRARNDADRQLQNDILAAIPADQLAAFQRANDPDTKTVNALVQRLNLPATTNDAVLSVRDAYAAQSIEIAANTALSTNDRRAQLRELANKAQAELQTTLGTDGAQVFAQRAQWLNVLKSGTAFSTNPKDATSGMRNINTTIYPVQPPPPSRKE